MATELGVRERAVEDLDGEQQTADFASIYREYFPSVWKRLARLGVPAAQLDDVTQEIFLAIHRKRGELRDPKALKAWITGFAIRAASDVRRNLRRRGTNEELSENLPAPNQTDARYERQEGLALLQRVLAQMSDELREAFVLIELEEMSGPEVALALNVNLNTVYSRLRVARVAFNRLIAELQGAA